MPLTDTDFEGFDVEDARLFLETCTSATKKKGEQYFRMRTVGAIKCIEPGSHYSATVQGGYSYDVQMTYEDGEWNAICSCPVGTDCKHVYAAFRQLLVEYSNQVGTNGKITSGSKPKNELTEFGGVVQEKLGRKLAKNEIQYLKAIGQLFRQSVNGQLNYHHDLTGLGLNRNDAHYWQRLELYPSRPKTEPEFWNYLALYLTDKAGQSIPEFMQCVTDLETPRAALRKHFRARDVQQWHNTLSSLNYGTEAVPQSPAAAELRVCLLHDHIRFEWREVGHEPWQELKPRKTDAFEQKFAPSLSAEAALLWLPFWQRTKIQYASNFSFSDPWIQEQMNRWLRQPLLRPLLADEKGEPLVFHDELLQWQVAAPEENDLDGDYKLSLVQADGRPVAKLRLTLEGNPTLYLTAEGVYGGPRSMRMVMQENNATLIPAKALESAGGLRLLDRLQAPPPPRLAAKIRTVKLHPHVRAEVKAPWHSSASEYCYVDVYGASDDGKHVENLNPHGWIPQNVSLQPAAKNELVSVDRSGLGALLKPVEQLGGKWDYQLLRWQLRVTKKFAATFVAFLKALPADARIDLAGELASFQNAEVAGKLRLEATESDMDWFNLRVIVDVTDTTLTKEEIKLLLDAKGGWVRLDQKGWRRLEYSLTEQEDEDLARLGLTPHELTSEPQRLHAFQLADKAARKFLPEETCERIERRAAELQARVTPEVPAEIQAELRPYQRDGFHFLAYLSANRFGGILADDMGLGKTLQTLSWLAWLKNSVAAAPANEPALPSLVVCPKSVADNWHAEAAKFFPGLKVRQWPASELKAITSALPSADLHVINYSQLRSVGEELARERFNAVILDEGQYIKNPTSQTAVAARQLRSHYRLVLSGTPIENRLLDLWSLMSFAMPGVLGNRAEFGRLYDVKNDPFARQRLSARVRPFLIRRTKAQVARDLPDRIEEDLFCELEGEQKTLYRAELKRAQAMLLGVKTAAALNKQRFNFLTSLLRLRQICCHPKLVKPSSTAVSAKVEALFETLEPLIEEGEKVLVFSQFVDLLDILRAEFKERKWPHWYLAGDTENRGDLVKEFQGATGAGVFLISLKAGGFGLNLTAASYVVLFDPWWNPAVENQAIDRTHRIGQDRKVIAYRLLIKDSIEEKIRALQRQKKSLAEDVLGEEKFSQGLSLDDLRYLLEG